MAKSSLLMQQTGWFSRVLALRSTKGLTTALCLLFLSLFSGNVYAMADMQTILTNLTNVILPLTYMLLVISYTLGVYMIFNAITHFKKFGNMSMQAQPGEFSAPLMKLVVGAALIYLPTSTDTITNSLFGSGNAGSLFGFGSATDYKNLGAGSSLLGYGSGDSFEQQWAALANTLVMYIQFLGLLSVIKGWLILSKSAGHGAQPGSVAKGFTHIIGGVVAMNFIAAVNVINNTIFGT